MKKLFSLILVGVLIFSLAACTKSNNQTNDQQNETKSNKSAGYQTITPESTKALLDAGEELVLVDVRTADEYKNSHILSAANIPNEDIGSDPIKELPDLNETIIVYCRTGRRSKEAAEKLIKLGYTDVRDMGGIVDWDYYTTVGARPGEWTKQKTPAQAKGILSKFSTTDLNGQAVNQTVLSNYKLTMVNVWTTYCGYCLKEMPELGELADEYKDKGVQIVGFVTDVLNSDGSKSESQMNTAKEIVNKTKADYLHIIPSQDLFGLVMRITSVPTTLFVDSNGNLVGEAYLGAKSKSEWKNIIEEKLKELNK